MIKNLVSVIIPAYNSEKYLRLAVDSVIQQTYTNIEILIIDDGSTDSTFTVAQELALHNKNIKVLVHEGHTNKGVSKSRQLGIHHANGEYIAFLDADDVFEKEKIQMQVECLQSDDDVVLSHTATSLIIESNSDKGISFSFNISDKNITYSYNEREEFLLSNFICNSSVLVRYSAIKDMNTAQHQIFQYEDWLVWSLLSYKGKFAFLSEKLTKYRYHQNSATYNVISNKLKEIYSYIEFLLNFTIRTEVYVHRKKALSLLRDAMHDLCVEYANQIINNEVELDTLFPQNETFIDSEIDILSLRMKENFLASKKEIQSIRRQLNAIESKIDVIDKSLSIKNIPRRIVQLFKRK